MLQLYVWSIAEVCLRTDLSVPPIVHPARARRIRGLLAALAMLVGACSGQPVAEAGRRPEGSPEDRSANGEELHLYSWIDYTSEDLLDQFTKETGIKVNLSQFDSLETMVQNLEADGADYDVIVPSDYIIPELIEKGLIQPINAFDLENAVNLDTAFLNPYFDPGRVYTAPYLYGSTGIAVNMAMVPDPPTSWAEFFAVPEGSDGSIGLLNDRVEVIHAALWAVGGEPCSEDPADFAAVDELLDGFKSSVSVVSSDRVIERMALGETSMHMEWNGTTKRAAQENHDVIFVYPSDGLTLWQDNFAVVTDSPNVENAKVFINWMMDPEHIAAASNWNGYPNAIEGSEEFLTEATTQSPMVMPPPGALDEAVLVEACSDKSVELYAQSWESFLVMAGGRGRR